jgi:hypothetical protein
MFSPFVVPWRGENHERRKNMKNTLIPHEICHDQWVITCPDLFPPCGYDQFSNRTYSSRDACQQAIDRLYSSLHDLLMTAFDVVEAWQDGDLAAAVRELDAVLRAAWKQT